MIGQRFGLVTVAAVEVQKRRKVAFVICDCGQSRWLLPSNLKRFPPATHKFCARGVQLELALDSVQGPPYGAATEA